MRNNRFENFVELIEYIYQQVYYYNNKQIHSVLKIAPVEFRLSADKQVRDMLSKKLGI